MAPFKTSAGHCTPKYLKRLIPMNFKLPNRQFLGRKGIGTEPTIFRPRGDWQRKWEEFEDGDASYHHV